MNLAGCTAKCKISKRFVCWSTSSIPTWVAAAAVAAGTAKIGTRWRSCPLDSSPPPTAAQEAADSTSKALFRRGRCPLLQPGCLAAVAAASKTASIHPGRLSIDGNASRWLCGPHKRSQRRSSSIADCCPFNEQSKFCGFVGCCDSIFVARGRSSTVILSVSRDNDLRHSPRLKRNILSKAANDVVLGYDEFTNVQCRSEMCCVSVSVRNANQLFVRPKENFRMAHVSLVGHLRAWKEY